jgi:hypothetical protein
MPTGTLAPVARQQFFDANGDPLALGKLYTYASGTATPSPIYTDALLQAAHPFPAVLDSGGWLTIYMPALAQKWILYDATNTLIWTVDPVSAVGLNASGVYEVIYLGGDSTSPITLAAYPSGATVDKTHAGTGLYVIDAATIASGTYVLQAMILSTGGGTVSVALVDLLAGLPDTPIATVTGTSATGASGQSSAITFAAGGSAHTYAIKTKITAGSGFAWGISIIKTG